MFSGREVGNIRYDVKDQLCYALEANSKAREAEGRRYRATEVFLVLSITHALQTVNGEAVIQEQ